MSGPLSVPVADWSDATVLLLLLPGRQPTTSSQAALQHQLGAGVLVLQVDEATYPAVVRSFAPAQLPTSVLVQHGVELWRQPGLPSAEEVHAVLREQARYFSP
ncbi:hypothetical protein [Hymenobacter swuensis]|uniref:Thioredoxin n=1 Tax=Hymenobacter swuensis DY53 TaxID=1227739 RepID=W8F4K4_9BACT|nr:hypothetical protein [Hymenobacter swuensis]AHJ97516.1 hypothetical protein Hsw_1921 [Hymenobacter swuensis DY53]